MKLNFKKMENIRLMIIIKAELDKIGLHNMKAAVGNSQHLVLYLLKTVYHVNNK